MWWYSRGIRACFRFRSLSIFCIFSSFVAFALYKPDEKQDAPATLHRNVAFILIPAFSHWRCFATSTQCSFLLLHCLCQWVQLLFFMLLFLLLCPRQV